MATQVLNVRVPQDVADRVEAAAGGDRSGWLRRAIEAALPGGSIAVDPALFPPKPVKAVVQKAGKPVSAPRLVEKPTAVLKPRRDPDRFQPLVDRVRDLLKSGGRSHRSIEIELGLSYPAVEAAIRGLGGEVHYPTPGIVALL